MMREVVRRTGVFVAKDRLDKEYKVYIDTTLSEDQGKRKEKGRQFLLDDGRSVVRLGKGCYEIVGDPAIRLTTADKNAP